MELANHVRFKPIEVEAGGIYSEKDIQKAREHILFPVTRAQILSDMVSVAMQHYVPGNRPNYESLLSPDHFQRATKNMMKRMWGRFIVFGQAMAGLLGVIMIVQICRTVISQLLACFDIYKKERRINWKMIAGLFPFVAKTYVFHGHSKDIDKMKGIFKEFKNMPPMTDQQFIWYLRLKLGGVDFGYPPPQQIQRINWSNVGDERIRPPPQYKMDTENAVNNANPPLPRSFAKCLHYARDGPMAWERPRDPKYMMNCALFDDGNLVANPVVNIDRVNRHRSGVETMYPHLDEVNVSDDISTDDSQNRIEKRRRRSRQRVARNRETRIKTTNITDSTRKEKRQSNKGTANENNDSDNDRRSPIRRGTRTEQLNNGDEIASENQHNQKTENITVKKSSMDEKVEDIPNRSKDFYYPKASEWKELWKNLSFIKNLAEETRRRGDGANEAMSQLKTLKQEAKLRTSFEKEYVQKTTEKINEIGKQARPSSLIIPSIIRSGTEQVTTSESTVEGTPINYAIPKNNLIYGTYTVNTLTEKQGPLTKIDVKINGRKVKALIDTGANISVIRYDVILPTEYKDVILQDNDNRAVGVNGETINFKGKLQCEISYMSTRINTEIHIAREINVPVLIGTDLLPSLIPQGVLDLSTMKLMHKSGVPYETIDVRAKEEIVIPRRSTVYLCVESPVKGQGEVIYEPYEHFDKNYKVATAATLVAINEKGEIPIQLTNFNDEEVRIKPNSRMGHIIHITEIEIVEPSEGEEINESDIKIDNENLTPEERSKVIALIMKYKNVFAKSDYDLTECKAVKHPIPLLDETPIKQKCYKYAHSEKKICDEEVEKMLKADVIEPSCSPWLSPVVLVKKKDGTTRFCIDYRKLNAKTKKDTFPLPDINDMLQSMHGAKYFTTMDLKSGYWQIAMAEEDKEKTAFSTGKDLYQFKRMPFGLTNAPATFQRNMNFVTHGLTQLCVYLDDVLVHGRTLEEHLAALEVVFIRLLMWGLKLKLSKCTFVAASVAFLGHILSEKGKNQILEI